jgi:integrase
VAPWAGQLLRYWLDVRAEQGIPGKMLFPSTKGTGKPWGKVAQYNAAREVLEAAGLDDVVGGSFRLRHTFALRQLRRGKSADDVAKWLGVSDPSVMVRYQRVLVAPIDVV